MAHARNATEVAALEGVLSESEDGGHLGWSVRWMTTNVTMVPGYESTDTATGYLRHGPNTRVEL